MPTPHSRPGRRSVVRSSDSNSTSTRPRQASGPASIRAGSSWWARIRPSRVVTATSMLVAPRSATRTWPPSARNVSWRGGRPPVLGPTSPSVTSPRSISSPTRWATMARPSPVRSTSSERDRDRPKPDLVEDGDERVEGLVGQRPDPAGMAVAAIDHAAIMARHFVRPQADFCT